MYLYKFIIWEDKMVGVHRAGDLKNSVMEHVCFMYSKVRIGNGNITCFS